MQENTGLTDLFTPIPVNRYGHCNFTLEEVLGAFALMIMKSTAQDLLVSTSVLPEPVQQQSILTIARELGASPKIVTPLELKKTKAIKCCSLALYGFVYVPKAGLEPARDCSHTPLKRARLPIPPLRRQSDSPVIRILSSLQESG